MVRRRSKKRGLSKKRTIRSSNTDPSDKTAKNIKRLILDNPVARGTLRTRTLETASNDISDVDADYRNWLGDTGDVSDVPAEPSESYAKAQELLDVLFSAGLGITPSVKIRKLLAVIDARFRELLLTRASSSKPRRRAADSNQTSLFDQFNLHGEKHD